MSIDFEYWYLLLVLAFAVRGFITGGGINHLYKAPKDDPGISASVLGLALLLLVQFCSGFDCSRWCIVPWFVGFAVGTGTWNIMRGRCRSLTRPWR